jgi:uncharacterized protein HemX
METNIAKLGVVLALIMIIIGVGAVLYALTRDSGENSNTTTTTTQPTNESDEATDQTQDQAQLPTIVFTDDGFAQSEYRFAEGTAIRVENQSSMDMQFSSNDHPAHRENPELNMALLGAGESGTITPPGKGTYGFHDHINDQYTGTLIIE